MKETPPKLVDWFLSKLPNARIQEMIDDLNDDHQDNLNRMSRLKARSKYIFDALRLSLLYLKIQPIMSKATFKYSLFSHIKFGSRSILKYKFYHSLNVASLALGFCCFTIVYLFVISQSQKDSFLTAKDQIVRLGTITSDKEITRVNSVLPALLKNDLPEIESFTRLGSGQVEIFESNEDNTISINRILAEPSFMDIFEVELLLGKNISPGSKEALLSEQTALKLWDNIEEAIGKEIGLKAYGGVAKLTVVGVTKNTPVHSSFSVDMVSAMNLDMKIGGQTLSLNSMMSVLRSAFFKVREGTNLDSLAGKIPELLKKHTENKNHLEAKYVFRTIDDIKYDQNISSGFISAVDGQAVLIFQIVALVILILAVANYINISTAITLKRIKEAGIKRIMGATGRSILGQQITESMIIGIASLSLSALILVITINWIQDFIGFQLVFEESVRNILIIAGICFPLMITLVGSIYPALLLSRFRFQDFTKGKWLNSPKSSRIRTLLLIVQFSIATFLIVGTFTFLKQLNFINELHNKSEMSQVLVINGDLGTESDIIKKKLQTIPEVQRLSLTTLAPGSKARSSFRIGTIDFEGSFDVFIIDENFLDLMGFKIADGQNFFTDDRSRPNHILINQALAETVKEGTPLNQEYETHGDVKTKVIGIVNDFPITSLKEKVKPTAYFQKTASDYLGNKLSKVILELSTDDMNGSIAKIEKEWTLVYPEQAFDIEFMEDKIDQIYVDELKMGKLFSGLTTIAIIIASMGIFGLLTYMVEIKTKEIGIRKVLGASFSTLASLLTRQIWIVLIVALFIAFPLSYYFLEEWLTSFVYRTEITLDIYIFTLISFVIVISITVFSQVRYASSLNPSDVLRSE